MTSSTAALALPAGFSSRPELSREATSRDLEFAPRHRWFYFPHSYSYPWDGKTSCGPPILMMQAS